MNKKNYFSALVAMFAMISVMILSSCSHDDYYYNEDKAEQALNDQYAIAFEKAFGKVGPNVDWGFGSKNSSTRAFTRAGGEVFEPTITFPDDYNDNLFFADVPDGVNKASGTEVNGGEWYIDGTFQQFAMRLTGIIYVKGTVDLSVIDGFEVNAGTKIYLVNGATLKIGPNSAWNLKGDIYIADGATLETTETTEKLKINGASKVYTQRAITTQDGGIIKVKDLEVNSTSILYNSGTIIATNGTVSAESNSSRIVNNGVIDCKDVVVNAGAVKNFLNWNVTGTTYINSNNSGWINNGQWTTNDYTYVAGSKNVINNCHLLVNNDFYINLSSLSANNDADMGFKINSGGSVETNNFIGGRHLTVYNEITGGPFRIYMAENSLFKVTNTATLESSRGPMSEGEVGFGFFGPSEGGYAVFQAENIVRETSLANTWGAVTYGGNLYVSAKTHFAQGDDGYAPHKYIFTQDGFSLENNIYAAGFKSGKPNITIEETPCSPGFYGDDPNPTYRVIAEDLQASEAGDFDFNDVVFDVEPNEAGTAAKIVVRAAGGIYKLTVAGVEVHEALGESANDGLYPMINTLPWDPDVKATLIESYSGDFSSDAAIRNTIKGIEIKVYKPGFEENGIELTATTGKAACKILVDKTFSVVTERTGIADENTNFHKYVQGTWDSEENGFWWQKKN
jgi:hypothetical protein